MGLHGEWKNLQPVYGTNGGARYDSWRRIMGKLKDRMKADLRLRNLRPSTQQNYLRFAHSFSAYHDRSPMKRGWEDVRSFLLHLREEKGHCYLEPEGLRDRPPCSSCTR